MSLERRPVRGAAWLLAGGLSLSFALVAGLYSLFVPSWEAPDEPAHFAYAAALLDTRALPLMTPGQGPTEAHQPPLYYMLAAALMAPVDRGDQSGAFVPNPDFVWAGQGGREANAARHGTADSFPFTGQALALHVARLASVLAGALAVALAVLLALELLPGRRSVALLAGGLVAFNPQFAFIGGVLSNDSLAALAGGAVALATVRAARAPERASRWLVVGALIGLALLTKLTTAFLLPLVAVAALALAIRRRSAAVGVRAAIGVGAPALALGGWWFARNQALYGDPFGRAVFEEIHAANLRVAPLGVVDAAIFAGKTFRSFWGTFGWMTIYLPEWMYGLALAASAVGLLWFVPAVALRRSGRLATGQLLGLGWLACAVLAQAVLLGVIAASCGESCYQGRYLFGAIVPFALLVAFALLAPAPERLALPLAGALVVALMGNAVQVLDTRLRPSYEADALTKSQARAAPANVEAQMGDDLELVGYELFDDRPNGPVLVTLYWRALDRPPVDYHAFVHLIDADGNILAQKDQPPGALAGQGATSWTRGDVVRDPHAVALPAGPTSYRLRVGLYDFATGAQLPVVRGGRPDGTFVVLTPAFSTAAVAPPPDGPEGAPRSSA